MRKHIVGSLLSLSLLSLLSGCRSRSHSSLVFNGPDGNPVAGIGEEPHRKLTWESADPNLPQFWIKVNPADFCENASNGVIASVSGKATCIVNANVRNRLASYQIYNEDPTTHNPVGKEPPVYYLFVQHCPGC